MLSDAITNRWKDLGERLEVGDALIIFPKLPQYQDNENPYPYRPDANFFYLTGIEDNNTFVMFIKSPQALEAHFFSDYLSPAQSKHSADSSHIIDHMGKKVIVVPKSGEADLVFVNSRQNHLFVHEWKRDPEEGVHGYIPPNVVEEMASWFKVKNVTTVRWPFQSQLSPEMGPFAHYDLLRDMLFTLIAPTGCGKDYRLQGISDASPMLRTMRWRKDQYELKKLTEASEVTQKSFEAVVEHLTRSDRVSEASIHGVAVGKVLATGMETAFPIVTAANKSPKGYTKHSTKPFNEGVVTIELGAWNGYGTHFARTLPISHFGAEQAQLARACYKAIQKGIEAASYGAEVYEINHYVSFELTSRLVKLGLLEGDPIELHKESAYLPLCPALGHSVGIEASDPAMYISSNGQIRLNINSVILIEAMIYIPPDWPHAEKFRGLSHKIAEPVIVTHSHGQRIIDEELLPLHPERLEEWMSAIHQRAVLANASALADTLCTQPVDRNFVRGYELIRAGMEEVHKRVDTYKLKQKTDACAEASPAETGSAQKYSG